MKDKRTYTNAKEHGEDMSHENETKIKHDSSLGETLPYLIEKHKKEIWDWNESQKPKPYKPPPAKKVTPKPVSVKSLKKDK